MEVKVLFFGSLSDVAGSAEKMVKGFDDTEQLQAYLESELPDLADHQFVISVNRKIIDQAQTLHDKDEVALLPPFSGG